jgi:crossover junction endodeoxyribonuclease RuvC
VVSTVMRDCISGAARNVKHTHLRMARGEVLCKKNAAHAGQDHVRKKQVDWMHAAFGSRDSRLSFRGGNNGIAFILQIPASDLTQRIFIFDEQNRFGSIRGYLTVNASGSPNTDQGLTKSWREPCVRRKLGAMDKMPSSPASAGLKKGCLRVIGIDPAAAGPTGFGIIETDGRRCRMLHYGALKVAPKRQKEGAGAQLQAVHARVCVLIEQYSPDALAIESVFTALNMRTALRLAEVRGVVLLAAAQHGVAVHSYAPREVKASVAGYGHASKRQMQLMIRALLAMNETPEPADAADALAVALCHLQADQVRRRFGLPDSAVRPRGLCVPSGSAVLPNEFRQNGATRRSSRASY